VAWMLDVHLYFTASFLMGGVHGLWRCGQLSANNIGERFLLHVSVLYVDNLQVEILTYRLIIQDVWGTEN